MLSKSELQTPINKSVGTKIPQKEYERINELVQEGLFLNAADFIRVAIRDKLQAYDNPITLRDIPYEQQREEIIEYIKEHPNVDAVDIADELLLDAFEVNDIIVELLKEGIIGEV